MFTENNMNAQEKLAGLKDAKWRGRKFVPDINASRRAKWKPFA